MAEDPVFIQLSQAPEVSGAFSMTIDGSVQSFSGDFGDGMAEMYAPVILSMLMDVKGVLDTRPVAGRGSSLVKTPETMKRIVLKHVASFRDHITMCNEKFFHILAMDRIYFEGDTRILCGSLCRWWTLEDERGPEGKPNNNALTAAPKA